MFMYCFAVIVAVPVWWRLTEIYRVHLPFESLDEVRKEPIPTLAVSLCFSESLKVSSESRDAIQVWLEGQINNLLRSSDKVHIAVHMLEDAVNDVSSTLPDFSFSDQSAASIFDDAMKLQLHPLDVQADITVFILASDKRSLTDGRVLIMGRYQHGWIFLPATDSFNVDTTINR